MGSRESLSYGKDSNTSSTLRPCSKSSVQENEIVGKGMENQRGAVQHCGVLAHSGDGRGEGLRYFSTVRADSDFPFVLSLSKHDDSSNFFLLKPLFWASSPGLAQGGPGHLGEPPPAVPPAGPRTSHSCAGFVHSPLSNLTREAVTVHPTRSGSQHGAPKGFMQALIISNPRICCHSHR